MRRGHNGSRKIAVAVAVGALLLASACSSGDDDDADGAGGKLSDITVSMPVIPPNFVHVMPWVAQDQGFYDKFGLKVKLVSLDTGVTALRGAQAGSADIAAVPTPTLISANAQGASVKSFYTYAPGLDSQMVVSKDIHSCEDLKGQVVGVDEVGGFAEVLTKQFYRSCGLTKDDVKYGNFPGAEGQAIAQGQAVSGVLHIDEAAAVMAQFPEAGMHVLANLWDVVPEWHYAAFAAPQKILDDKRDEIIAFTAANIMATEFMNDSANKDAVLDTAEEVTGLERKFLSDAYDTFLKDKLLPEENGLPKDMIDYTVDQQVELGNIKESDKPSYDELVDVSIYDEARALVDEQS